MKIKLIFILIIFGCSKTEPAQKFKISTENTIDVSANILDFETDQIISMPYITVLDQYLLITDLMATSEKGIHIYNKNSLQFITSTVELGEGPGEIMRIGEVALTSKNNEFWMPDLAKLQAFKFDLDSILLDSSYKPTVSIPIPNDFFLVGYSVVSDSIALGSGVEVLSPSTFRVSLVKWNLITGEAEKFGYEHPSLANQSTNAFFNYSN